jgi:hypothetical protein
MSFLGTKLAQLETRLKTLVEEGISRFVISSGKLDGLSASLLAAMQAGVQLDAVGTRFAPDRYVLSVNPEDAHILREDPSLLSGLADTIQEAGKDAGLHFPSPPQVKVIPDPGLPKHQVRIQAHIGQEGLSETSASGVTLEENSASMPTNAFLIVEGNQVFPLTQAVINIGRRLDNHIVLDDARVSRVHAQLRAIRGRYVIFDLGSSGGTFINGVRLGQSTLAPGDVISLAGFNLVFGQDESGSTGSYPGETQPVSPF